MDKRQQKLKAILNKNQFIVPSFSEYGGFSGFHDYGILGTKLKNNFLREWRDMFLHNENIDEIETPIVMPYEILKTSGHVDRFTDYVVTDKNGEVYRADHLVKDYFKNNGMNDLVDKVDSYSASQLEFQINKYKMLELSADNDGNPIPLKVMAKNLMFATDAICKNDNNVDFLRPELAQGIFVNFNLFKQFYKKEPPFGIAQIGKSYRMEISPKTFTRMREFTQAEIEYFCDPNDKTHSKFDEIKDCKIPILSSSMQQNNKRLTIYRVDEATVNGIINSQLMAYFMVRVYQFAIKMNLKENKVRFRQHLPNEMAHYANQCWDLECLVNDDWLECVGIADRGSYDLEAHSKYSNLVARRKLDNPISINRLTIDLDKRLVGQKYKSVAKDIFEYFDSIDQNKMAKIKETLEREDFMNISINDLNYTITKDMVKFENKKITMEYEDYYPHVIEPSFGIDRLIYAIIDHNYYEREEDNRRLVISLPECLAPYDIAVFALHNKENMNNLTNKIKEELKRKKYKVYVDNSSVAIGKKYVRIDEIGIKYAITIDPGSLIDNMVTIRDRDSMKQIRVPIDKLTSSLKI